MLDTFRTIETPEGAEIGLRVAGPLIRSGAWIIDFGIRVVAMSVLFPLLTCTLGNVGVGIGLVLAFFAFWFYPIVFEAAWNGQTPGKKFLKLAVVHDDGTPIGWGAALIRNLVRVVDFLPGVYLIGLLTTLLNSDFKRLGDLAARTVVVYRRSERIRGQRVPQVQPRAPARPLSQVEQEAVLAFAERRETWTDERAAELADTVYLLTGSEGPDGVERLMGVANWVLGRR
ncbi:MAG: RDD family protein [Planctomycetes bacterium]|nr:RDD family protein [Planctomycetota bacterium]